MSRGLDNTGHALVKLGMDLGWSQRPMRSSGVLLSRGNKTVPIQPLRQWNQNKLKGIRNTLMTHGDPELVDALRKRAEEWEDAGEPDISPQDFGAGVLAALESDAVDNGMDMPAAIAALNKAVAPDIAGPCAVTNADIEADSLASVHSIAPRRVEWVMPHVISEQPWETSKGVRAGQVMDRTLSDGTHLYICSMLGCSFSNAKPHSVSVHYNKALDHQPAIALPCRTDPRYLAGTPNRTMPMPSTEPKAPDATLDAIRELVSPELLAEVATLRRELADNQELLRTARTERDTAMAALVTLQDEWDAVAGMMAGRR